MRAGFSRSRAAPRTDSQLLLFRALGLFSREAATVWVAASESELARFVKEMNFSLRTSKFESDHPSHAVGLTKCAERQSLVRADSSPARSTGAPRSLKLWRKR
jgi:hypothetical protein